MAKVYVVYKYTSPSGKSYIGQTCDMRRRAKNHKSTNSGCVAFSNAIKKYGFENFDCEILADNLTLDDANILEETYINSYNTLHPNGYNLKHGGDSMLWSDASKDKMSNSMMGSKNHFYGKTHKESSKQLNREAHIGDRGFWFGKVGKDHPSYGSKRTEDEKLKMSMFMRGRYAGKLNPMYGVCGENSIHAKTYKIIHPDGKEEVVTGMHNFCKSNNLDSSCMIKVAKGKYKHHKGFTCAYYNEE